MEKIRKKYVNDLIAGAAVRDSNGKVISESLQEIDNKASLLDNVVVTEADSVINKVRAGGTIITVGEIDEEELQNIFESSEESGSLQFSYETNNQEPEEFKLIMPEDTSGSNETSNLTLSYIE